MNPFYSPVVGTRASSVGTKLRERLSNPTAPILVCPGVYDALSTQIAMSLGFEALYLVSSSPFMSTSRFNTVKMSPPSVPILNNGLMTSPLRRYHAEIVSSLALSLTVLTGDVPLIAGGDTCHGGPVMTERTVHLYSLCGIAAVHIEDALEVSPPTKTSQHTHSEIPASLSVFEARVTAGVRIRNATRSSIMVMAHTTATNPGCEEAITRLRVAQACGADMGVLTGIKDKADAAKVAMGLKGFPMMLQLVHDSQGGLPPLIYPHEAEAMGYKALIFPIAAMLPAEAAITQSLSALKQSLFPSWQNTERESSEMEMMAKGVGAL